MSNSPHRVGNLTTLSNVHTSCPNLKTRYEFRKTSECAHKMYNSPHEVSNLARFPNMHTRGRTLSTGKAFLQDFRMCTQEVQVSTRDRQFGKTSEYAHKRCNSPLGIGESARLPNAHTRGPTLNTG
ncbi:hypothetical protein PoB_002417900 [Plakobranchus ocellatus]|uniref:Uncharacterized protein n=1 Tax=Plakobranchus ocellatus TaxID=259542 RepID=A0AAV3ZUT4_9GAST|nr:hypothetical protein PoB_002417900 [Plakobranchus ocellatus]